MARQADVTDAYTRRTLTLLRQAEGEAIDVSKRLRRVHDSIYRDMEKSFTRPRTLAGVEALQKNVKKKLSGFYQDEWPRELLEIEAEVVTAEIAWGTATIGAASSSTLVSPRSEAVMKSARRRPYQGHTFAYHVKKAFNGEAKRVNDALRTGYIGGKSVQEMTRQVSGVLGRADRDVRTITRSYFMHNATEAKNAVFQRNPSIVESIIWISTLDARTTPLICGIRDGLEYTLDYDPIDHGVEWDAGPGRIHWNCRSSSAPKLNNVEQPATPRPAIGAGRNYERGDNRTRTGRVRKPNKRERDKGLFKVEQRTTRTKYEGWLREQSRKNIDFAADVLGSKQAARAFRDGQVTLAQLNAASPVANPLRRGSILNLDR